MLRSELVILHNRVYRVFITVRRFHQKWYKKVVDHTLGGID